MSKEKIKTCQKLDSGGKPSCSISFENGKGGLLTGNSLAKEYGGIVPPELVVGAEVEVVFEDVPNKNGTGTWTALKFPGLIQHPQGGQKPSSGYGSAMKGEDPLSKIINTASMVAASLLTGGKELRAFNLVFDEVFEAMWAKYSSKKS